MFKFVSDMSYCKVACLNKESAFFKTFPFKWVLSRIKGKFVHYFKKFSVVLEKHYENEFEVPIRLRKVTADGDKMLDDLEGDFQLLQFEEVITQMVNKYKSHCRIKNRPYVIDLLNVVCDDIINEIECYVSKKHNEVLKDRRSSNNRLCSLKSKSGPSIMNFTDIKLPNKLVNQLQKGLKYVPTLRSDQIELQNELKEEVISCCKEIYRSQYDKYPVISKRDTFDEKILAIISQCESNSEVVDQLSNIRNNFVESIPAFMSSLSDSSEIKAKDLVALLPKDCIISASDKNVGISILPPDWFKKEYENQIVKGGHQLITMSEESCIALLLRRISDFKQGCSRDQLVLLNKFWAKETVQKYRLGVMKLIPKVHKLSGDVHKDSWKNLPSRPIRGAELDPMKQPSRVLFKLLQRMLSQLKANYSNLTMFQLQYPVLNGCDDYINRLDGLRLKKEQRMKTIMITADFSDAFTETCIKGLKKSILQVGELMDIPYYEIDLMNKLVDLVFLNSYFYTPNGLYRQTRGMPMGDYSSRCTLVIITSSICNYVFQGLP